MMDGAVLATLFVDGVVLLADNLVVSGGKRMIGKRSSSGPVRPAGERVTAAAAVTERACERSEGPERSEG